MHSYIHACTSTPKYIHEHTAPSMVHADTPMAPHVPQQAAHVPPTCAHARCMHTPEPTLVLLPGLFLTGSSWPPGPRHFPSCFWGREWPRDSPLAANGRGEKRRGEGRAGQGMNVQRVSGLRFQPVGEGLSSSKQTSLLIPYSTHLQAGHPDAHRPHEQQVVG